MIKQMCICIVIGLGGLSMVGCEYFGLQSDKPQMIDQSADGQTLTIELKQKLEVQLDANHSTGYEWQIVGDLPPGLQQIGEREYHIPIQLRDRGGVGGTEIWTFQKTEPGTGKLTMAYRRPWEADKPAAETFSVQIEE